MITTSKSGRHLGQGALERVLPTGAHQQHRLGARQVDVGGQQRHALRRRHQRGARVRRRRAAPRGSTPPACRGPDPARTSDTPADPGRRAAPVVPSPPSPHPTTPPSSSWRPHPFDWRPQVPASRVHPSTCERAAVKRACGTIAGVSVERHRLLLLRHGETEWSKSRQAHRPHRPRAHRRGPRTGQARRRGAGRPAAARSAGDQQPATPGAGHRRTRGPHRRRGHAAARRVGLRRLRGPDHAARSARRCRTGGVDARLPGRRERRADHRARRPRRRPGAVAHGVARRGVRRARPLLARR